MLNRTLTPAGGLAALVVLAASLLLSASVCDPDKGSYVKANEKLLATLPVMDGATHTATQTFAHRVHDGTRIAGYSTQWTYALPATVSAAKVEQFYSDALAADGWTLHRATVGCLQMPAVRPDSTAEHPLASPFPCDADAVELAFRKGKVFINVHLPTGAWAGEFTVGLDHDYT
ncbi:MAG: hypothetical protein ACRDG3_11040, partial [Tepidiformaceae bacterium]